MTLLQTERQDDKEEYKNKPTLRQEGKEGD